MGADLDAQWQLNIPDGAIPSSKGQAFCLAPTSLNWRWYSYLFSMHTKTLQADLQNGGQDEAIISLMKGEEVF